MTHDLVYLRKDSDLQRLQVCPFLPSARTPPQGTSPLVWTAGQPPWLPTCSPHLRWTYPPPQSSLHLKSKPATPWAEALGGLSPILPGSLQISARAEGLWEVFLSLPGKDQCRVPHPSDSRGLAIAASPRRRCSLVSLSISPINPQEAKAAGLEHMYSS